MPLELLHALAIGSILAVLSAMIVNMTLTPAILLVFDGFFKRGVLSAQRLKEQERRAQVFSTNKRANYRYAKCPLLPKRGAPSWNIRSSVFTLQTQSASSSSIQ